MASIYKDFSKLTKLPIYLKDVKDFVLKTGCAQAITRYPVDIDELHLHGMLRVFRDKPPYALEERVMAQIAYYRGLDEPEIRLVCCKEMLHLLDNHHETASTRELVSQLIDDVTLPIEAVMSLPGLTDHSRIVDALCVLVPSAAANLLRAAHRENKISPDDVATLARIPEPFARVILTDRFAELQQTIMSEK